MLNNLLDFDQHTFYILMAYGISFSVLLGLVIISLRQRAHYARLAAVKNDSEILIRHDTL